MSTIPPVSFKRKRSKVETSASGGYRNTRMTSPQLPKTMNNAPIASNTEKMRNATCMR